MEKFLKEIFCKENIRTLLILVVIFACFNSLNSKMDVRFAEVDLHFAELRQELMAEINSLREEVRSIKTNDIEHIYMAIEALTFTMVKNKILTQEDKDYIDSRLKPR